MSKMIPSTPSVPKWLHQAVFYQIYPPSFRDGNGDGIGDLRGIIEKLDYVKDLGCNALWLNPVFCSPFRDGGYDVTDFRRVDPRYGTNEDLERLVVESHRRGIRVVLDLVAGHTSVDHPWFLASSKVERNEFSDYYVWTDSAWDSFFSPGCIPGHPRDACYLPNYFPFQPSLNYGYASPDPTKPWQQAMDAPGPRAVLRELREIMAFWLACGVDGFRVDMAASLVRGDPDGKGIRKFWQEMRAWLEANYEEKVLIAEWTNPTAAIRAGFHVDFMIHFGEPAYLALCEPSVTPKMESPFGYFDARGEGDVNRFLDNYLPHYHRTRRLGYIALPTGNHDFNRFRYRRNEEECFVFLAFLLTMPGVPFIFYGDELGLSYREGLPSKEGGYGRTGTRIPMQWDAGANRGFSSASADQLYLPANDHVGEDVAAQKGKEGSLFEWTKKLLELRRSIPALGNDGVFIPLDGGPTGYPFFYERAVDDERILVAINPSETPVRWRLPLSGTMILSRHADLDGECLVLSSFSFAMLRVDDRH